MLPVVAPVPWPESTVPLSTGPVYSANQGIPTWTPVAEQQISNPCLSYHPVSLFIFSPAHPQITASELVLWKHKPLGSQSNTQPHPQCPLWPVPFPVEERKVQRRSLLLNQRGEHTLFWWTSCAVDGERGRRETQRGARQMQDNESGFGAIKTPLLWVTKSTLGVLASYEGCCGPVLRGQLPNFVLCRRLPKGCRYISEFLAH